MEELDAYAAGVHACGHHKSLITEDNIFQPELDVCPVCAGAAAYGRTLQAEDEAARKKRGENTAPGTPLPSDGRTFSMRMLTGPEAEKAREQLLLQQRQHQEAPGEA